MNRTYGASPEAWRHWAHTLGLKEHLLPVVSNPGATISKTSTMTALGKTPSDYNFRRQARGITKWTQMHANDKLIDHWMQEPDYGICVQSRAIRAIDIDIDNPRRAQRVVRHIERTLPYHFFPVRSRSDSGKVLLAFKLDAPLTKRVVPAIGGMIEILGDGQQFVAVGTHPKGQRYEWDGGLPDDFPTLDMDDFDILWGSLCTAFLKEGEEPRIARERRKIADMADLPDVDDPLASWLVANWEVHESGVDGQLYIRCPFERDHTVDTGISSTAYFPAGTNGYEQGHFKCMHAHCEGRHDTDFMHEVGYLQEMFDDLTQEELSDDVHGGAELTAGRDGSDAQAVDLATSAGAVDRPWPRFTRQKDGSIDGTARNLRLAIEREDIVCTWLAYDTFGDQLVRGDPREPRDKVSWRAFTDEDYVDLRIKLEERGFKPFGKEMLRDVVWNVAKRHRVDIAQEWLSRLEWDGVPRVDDFFHERFRAPKTRYAVACGRYLWSAMAGRVMQPGVKADMAPILKGGQGKRKTSAIEAMVPHEDMYASLDLEVKEADLARRLRGKLIGELEELRGLNSRKLEEIKAWMSRRFEEWVPKYREMPTKMPRRLIMIGSTNMDEILADETGERRWLPIAIGEGDEPDLDVEGIRRDRDQLWAEGAHLFAQYGVLYKEAEQLAKLEHHKFKVVDPWAPLVERWLAEPAFGTEIPNGLNPEGVTTTQCAIEALQIAPRSVDRGVQMRISNCLKALGYERVQIGRKWVYKRPSEID